MQRQEKIQEKKQEKIQAKMRLDHLMTEKGLAGSRARAADLIRRGAVSVDGAVALKPGQNVSAAAKIVVAEEAGAQYVSRGALKLIGALDAFAFSPEGRVAFDVGASTGGFTEVLLERGAAQVIALDVGRGQLHERLRQDPRVINLENTDVRGSLDGPIFKGIGAVVIDVSFISLIKVLPHALYYAAPGAWLVALIKPQFEVGRAAIGKGGLVKDVEARRRAVEDVQAFLAAQPGWKVAGVIASPIKGQDGNQEFLIGAHHAG